MHERLLLSLLCLCALALPSEASAQDAVVLASTAPGYAPGDLIPDGTTIRVPEGAKTTLLLSTGRSVPLHGPFEGRPGDTASAASPGASLGQIWSGNTLSQTELGASRALEDMPPQPVPAIDPSHPGRHCVAGEEPPLLRRPSDPALAGIALSDPETGITATLQWTAAGTMAWPAGLPAEDGSRIMVLDQTGKPRHEIQIRRIDAAAPSWVGVAVELAAAGCRHQAVGMLEPVSEALVPLDLYLSTDRGLFPTYRPGEPTQLVLQTNRDAHLYCYLRTARGDLIPIFPSSHSGGTDIKGHVPVVFPGERMPLPLHAENQEVACHATERDLTAELPGRNAEFQPLQGEAVAGLDRALAALDGPELASARIVLRAD